MAKQKMTRKQREEKIARETEAARKRDEAAERKKKTQGVIVAIFAVILILALCFPAFSQLF